MTVAGPDAAVGAPVPRQKSRATVETLRTGCIALVQKDGQYRRAEILSIKTTKSGQQFYCNFDNYNKRLDEWVPASRIDFDQDVEWPLPEKEKPKKTSVSQKKNSIANQKKAPKRSISTREASIVSTTEEVTPSHPWTEFVDSQVNTPGGLDTNMSMDITPIGEDDDPMMDLDEAAKAAKNQPPEKFSREEEIEKLRTGGSMTQNPAELSRIRNISKVQFGKYDLNPWYFSPYPRSFENLDVMYICEFCLLYFGDLKAFSRHRHKCAVFHPPGNEIYRDENISFFEIDGRRQRTWCRNLCLLSKMFLDHKAIYYDVDPFLFYVMTSRDEKGFHLIGYFSKEKESLDNYNVACILTLPQRQRQGYGKLLIQFSYELSKIENKLGSPEKPLSDLGLLSYRQYWTENIVEILLAAHENSDRTSIEQLAQTLAMTTADVEHTLQALKMQVYHKGEHKIVVPTTIMVKHKAMKERQRVKPKRLIDPQLIQWKPPVFTASARTWAW